MKEYAAYWAEHYDWRRCEAQLNALPQYSMMLDGLEIYFLHIRSPEPDATPILLTHGWPGSVLEFMDIIAPLANPKAHGAPNAPAFHLVIPALPGFGYSGKPQKNGWNIAKIAQNWARLMDSLGYDHYVAQGGDWGAIISIEMARQKPKGLAAIHSNMVLAMPAPHDPPNADDQAAFAQLQRYMNDGNGYAQIQRTRPQTIGYALTDSPVGQMAWILEKFIEWSDVIGDPAQAFNRDHLLDNITLYWLTASAASSARIYWESFGSPDFSPIDLPMGGSIFAHDIMIPPRHWAEKRFSNIQFWREHNKGGHFAAMEKPDAFIQDVRDCFAAILW